MIDALVILFSAGMCLLVAFRAVRLDAVLPWFGPEAPADPAADRRGTTDVAQGWRARAQPRR